MQWFQLITPPRPVLTGLAPLMGVILFGCSLVHNYDDPDGPRYDGQFSTDPFRSSEDFTLATFNIKFAEKVERAIDELQTDPELCDASLLLLQEMDPQGTDTIAERLGYDYVYYPGSKHNGKDFGNAVLSRWPIVSDEKLILPYRNPANGRIRIAVRATLDTPEGRLVVYSVHTETPWLGPAARLEQVEAIVDDAADVDEQLAIGGDFNTLEERSIEETVELFGARGFTWATRSVAPSTTSPVGSFNLDHVFVRKLEARFAKTQPSSASDHQPIWVGLRNAR